MLTTKRIFFTLLLLSVVSTVMIVGPVSALPPRPTPVPPEGTAVPLPGGFIVLEATLATAVATPLWTRVQWQDTDGDWHEVDGWRGAFDHDMTVTWWVAPIDLGTGPFRWLVYAAEDSDEIITVSEPFFLPPVAHQTTTVTMSIP